MADFIAFLEKHIFNGKKSLTAIFITSWMLWNWQVIVVLFFDNAFPKMEEIGKIPKIIQLMQSCIMDKNISVFLNEFVMPFLISVFRYFFISHIIEKIELYRKNYKKLKFNKEITFDATPLLLLKAWIMSSFFVCAITTNPSHRVLVIVQLPLLIISVVFIMNDVKEFINFLKKPKKTDET